MKTWTIAALSEMGRIDSAREEAAKLYGSLCLDWRSNREPSPRTAGDWLADMFPIREAATRERIRGALAEAGLA